MRMLLASQRKPVLNETLLAYLKRNQKIKQLSLKLPMRQFWTALKQSGPLQKIRDRKSTPNWPKLLTACLQINSMMRR